MLWDLAACPFIKHDLTIDHLIQRLIVTSRQKKGSYAVLTAAARGDIPLIGYLSNSILKLTYFPPVSSSLMIAS